MKLESLEALVRVLNEGRVRYLVAGGLAVNAHVRFVSLATLIAMKQEAGRPRDLDDVEHLRWILEDGKPHE